MNRSKIFKVFLLAATLLLAGCTGEAEEEEETVPPNDGPELTYSFEGSDTTQDNSANGGDELLHVVMNQGDSIGWAAVKVTISVDDEAPVTCEAQDSSAPCTYDPDNDQSWSVGESITISEGQNNICSEGCNIAVTITNTQESKVLDSFEVYVN